MRNFHIGTNSPAPENVFGPELRDEIAEGFRVAKGMFGLLKEALNGTEL